MRTFDRVSSCEGKDRFTSAPRAEQRARRMRRIGKRVSVYKCEHCRSWHIGPEIIKGPPIPIRKPRQDNTPTPQRRAKGGAWVWIATDKKKAARALDTHPVDRMEHAQVISKAQGQAARDFEALYRAQCEIPQVRDSSTIWEPRGYESDDGPTDSRARYKALVRRIGAQAERQLTDVCVYMKDPRPSAVGLLREALNECARFFQAKAY